MGLDRQQHDRPAAYAIAQQYSSPNFVFWRRLLAPLLFIPASKTAVRFQTCYYFIVFTLI